MHLPLPILSGLQLMPNSLCADLFGRIVNHLLRGQDIAERLDYLEGKVICLALTDTGNRFHLRIRKRRLVRCSPHMGWDARISGTLEGFWRLASRSEDPDTLFFNRDLTLEGDTDAALYLKNLLDAVEFDLDRHLQEVAGTWLAPYIRKAIDRGTPLAERARKLVQARALPM